MDVLDRVLDGDHVTGPRLVDAVQERGQRGAFARPGGPGHDDQAVGQVAQAVQAFREAQLGERAEAVFQPADGDRQPALPAEDVEAVPRAVAAGHGAVQRAGGLQRLAVQPRGQMGGHARRVFALQRAMPGQRLQQALDAEIRRQPRHEVQIGGVLAHALGQQAIQQGS